MSAMSMAPTLERVRKSADVDLPIVDTKRRRDAYWLRDPVVSMARDGRIRDEQLAAFRMFERDIAITEPSRALLARIGDTPGGSGDDVMTDILDIRAIAFRRLSDIERSFEPMTFEALKSMVFNEMSLEQIGRRVLKSGNKTAAIAAAARTVQQGTWALAVYYGIVTPTGNVAPRPG